MRRPKPAVAATPPPHKEFPVHPAFPERAHSGAPRTTYSRPVIWSLAASVPLLAAGCVIRPEGTEKEQRQLDAAGAPFEPAVQDRVLPELPEKAAWRDILHRAFLAN